jgi:hypothetical protein
MVRWWRCVDLGGMPRTKALLLTLTLAASLLAAPVSLASSARHHTGRTACAAARSKRAHRKCVRTHARRHRAHHKAHHTHKVAPKPTTPSKATPPSTPTTAPVATLPPPADGGTVLFNGLFKAAWHDQSATPTRVSQVPDPAGGPATALQFTAYNSDVYPATPTKNPRAQLVTPSTILHANTPFWESYQLYLPTSFPTAQTYNNAWLALGSPFYGAPYDGSPSMGLEITNGMYRWGTNSHAQVHGATLWQSPIVLGRWMRFTWYVNPAANGFAELYVNGQAVSVSYNGQSQDGANFPVVDQSNFVGPWVSQISAYYGLGEFPQVTMFFKNFVIGTSKGAAESATA